MDKFTSRVTVIVGCVAAEAQIIEMTQNEARNGSDSIISLGIDQLELLLTIQIEITGLGGLNGDLAFQTLFAGSRLIFCPNQDNLVSSNILSRVIERCIRTHSGAIE